MARLTRQYRMNAQIMSLSNRLVYGGAMTCGTAAVATGALAVPDPAALLPPPGAAAAEFERAAWLQATAAPGRPVVFLDTGAAAGPGAAPRAADAAEAAAAVLTAAALLRAGVAPAAIGIICPYRARLRQIRALMDKHGPRLRDVELNTIDRYQGRDKECIIVSFSVSASGAAGILSDARRLNVALSRAKHKLVLLGDRAKLAKVGSPVVDAMLGIVDEEGWGVALPRGRAREEDVGAVLGAV